MLPKTLLSPILPPICARQVHHAHARSSSRVWGTALARAAALRSRCAQTSTMARLTRLADQARLSRFGALASRTAAAAARHGGDARAAALARLVGLSTLSRPGRAAVRPRDAAPAKKHRAPRAERLPR
jgi:hypothetical protein